MGGNRAEASLPQYLPPIVFHSAFHLHSEASERGDSGILGAHSSENRAIKKEAPCRGSLSPKEEGNAWSEDRVGFRDLAKMAPWGVTNASELCFRTAPKRWPKAGGKSVVIPGALGMGAIGKVPWSLVLVIDEDSPPELPAWGQARWAGSKKQQGLPTSDLFRDALEPLGLRQSQWRWKGSPLKNDRGISLPVNLDLWARPSFNLS